MKAAAYLRSWANALSGPPPEVGPWPSGEMVFVPKQCAQELVYAVEMQAKKGAFKMMFADDASFLSAALRTVKREVADG